jgi:hypothetical protein
MSNFDHHGSSRLPSTSQLNHRVIPGLIDTGTPDLRESRITPSSRPSDHSVSGVRTPKVERELEAGLIYVRFEDPVSQLVMALSHHDYSAMGFYSTSTATGKFETLVVLIDAFRLSSPAWVPARGITLEELRHRPDISRLARRKLQPIYNQGHVDVEATRKLQFHVRTSVSMVMSQLTKLSLSDAIDRLLNGVSPFDEILKLFRFDQAIFDRPQELTVENHGSIDYDSSELRAIIEILTSQPNRYQRFINRITPARNLTEIPAKCHDLIDGLCQGTTDLVNTLGHAMVSGNLNFDVLRELVERNNGLFEQAGNYLGHPINPVSLPRLETERTMSVRDSNSDLGPFHDFVVSLINASQRGNITLHLNDLIDLHNRLIEPKIQRLVGERSYPAIVVVSNTSQIPITLSTGTQIILPSKGADLTSLSLDQLKEIATILDDLDTDGRFETLRSDVARRLAHLQPGHLRST